MERGLSQTTSLNICGIEARYTPSGKAGARLEFFHAAADEQDPAARSGDIVGRYTGGRPAPSMEFSKSVQAWLKSCYGHAKCSRTFSGSQQINSYNSPLPTRCVHICRPETNGPLQFTLRDTSGETGRYITLSHRWNDETSTSSTTRDNVSQRLQGEGLGELPLLFTDAFTLAFQLGIPYVWIDSLCIVQSDMDEWKTESCRMADYYQRSVFTVACPGAGIDTGLFDKAAPIESSRLPLIRLPYRDRSGQQQGHFYLFQSEKAMRTRYRKDVTDSDLLTRGWVFQEWILSRRIVCYTRSGLFFLCQQDYPRNQLGEGVTSQGPAIQGISNFDFSLKFTVPGLYDQEEPGDNQKAWEEVIEAYSGLRLTKAAQDRLVALSGIVDEFRHVLDKSNHGPGDLPGHETVAKSVYITGLWLHHVNDRGLLWEQVSKGVHERIKRFPTWSWASLYAQVRWVESRPPPPRHFSNTHPDPVTTNIDMATPLNQTWAEVSSPSSTAMANPTDHAAPNEQLMVLCLHAKLQPVILGQFFSSIEEKQIVSDLAWRRPRVGMDNWRMVASPLDPDHIAGWASIEHPEMQIDENNPVDSHEAVYALHVSTVWHVPGGFPLGYMQGIHHVYNVLFVRRAQNTRDGYYERVGVGRLFGREVDQGLKHAAAADIFLI
ncbi:heterokaryon incompatibility protein-domain-containing protein [Lasiosphaeria hispida]|uniref:Heterokaryon incompatibility protein-domain-containing protein n=1 Tax=Lasiosphaeria hispida TaxID=260671 RepID=A0AAJ0MET8_9PEZI|nr:heterokaryon incompatibility protein-domain-containing protein [Lasiosphaeria hispida]